MIPLPRNDDGCEIAALDRASSPAYLEMIAAHAELRIALGRPLGARSPAR
jgi:hypothetical protein